MLEPCHAVARATPINLELGLTGPPTADASRESGQRDVRALREPRQPVPELRQLDLELAVAGGRVLRENVEDELRAIDNAQLHACSQVARLRGRQVLVDDDEINVALEGADPEVL